MDGRTGDEIVVQSAVLGSPSRRGESSRSSVTESDSMHRVTLGRWPRVRLLPGSGRPHRFDALTRRRSTSRRPRASGPFWPVNRGDPAPHWRSGVKRAPGRRCRCQRFRPLHSGSTRFHSRPQSAALRRSSHRRRRSQTDAEDEAPEDRDSDTGQTAHHDRIDEGQRRVDDPAFAVHPRPHGLPGGRAPVHRHIDVVLGPRCVDVVRRPHCQRARSPVRHRSVHEHRGHRRPFVCSRAGPIDRATVDAHPPSTAPSSTNNAAAVNTHAAASSTRSVTRRGSRRVRDG